MMNKKNISIIMLISMVILWNLTVLYVDEHLEKNRDTKIYDSCYKVWSSRGLYRNYHNQNSIQSFVNAFKKGALGAEVDFHYDVKTDRFIISHDHPVKDSNGNLVYTKKNGKLLTLEALFNVVGKGHYFWLDYKNLDKLSTAETQQAIARLLYITQGDGIRERLYIEGSNPLLLSMYTDAGLRTILGIHPLRESNLLSSIVVNGYKMAYYFNNISGLALAYGSVNDPIYGAKTEKSLGNIPLFLFHVPDDQKLLHQLVHNKRVKVLLVGRDKSLNRFHINSCE